MLAASISALPWLLMEKHLVAMLLKPAFEYVHHEHIVVDLINGFLVEAGHLILVHSYLSMLGLDWHAELQEVVFTFAQNLQNLSVDRAVVVITELLVPGWQLPVQGPTSLT